MNNFIIIYILLGMVLLFVVGVWFLAIKYTIIEAKLKKEIDELELKCYDKDKNFTNMKNTYKKTINKMQIELDSNVAEQIHLKLEISNLKKKIEELKVERSK